MSVISTQTVGEIPFSRVNIGDIFTFLPGVSLMFLGLEEFVLPVDFTPEHYHVKWYEINAQKVLIKSYSKPRFILYRDSQIIRNGELLDLKEFFQ